MLRELDHNEITLVSGGQSVWDSIMGWLAGDDDDLQTRFNPAASPIVDDREDSGGRHVTLANNEIWHDHDNDGNWDARTYSNPNGPDFVWNERTDSWQTWEQWQSFLDRLIWGPPSTNETFGVGN